MIIKSYLKDQMARLGFRRDHRNRIVPKLRSIEEQLDTMIHTTQINETRATHGLKALAEQVATAVLGEPS